MGIKMISFPEIRKPVIIIPFHFNSALLYHALSGSGIEVLGFWDNGIDGKSYDGVPITPPIPAAELCLDVTVIVYYKKYEDAIKAQLEGLGYADFISAQTIDKSGLNRYIPCICDNDLHSIRPDLAKIYTRELRTDSSTCIPITSDYDDVFLPVASGRRILLISHELTLSGAPVCVQQAARVFLRNGDMPVVLSNSGGGLVDVLLRDGIPVLIDYKLLCSQSFADFASRFDLVLVNTLANQNIAAIEKLKSIGVPVLLWIHETSNFYSEQFVSQMPEHIGDNIHIYCVSSKALEIFSSYFPALNSGLLPCGICDFYEAPSDAGTGVDNKLQFMTVGTIELRKGQDIFCSAIRMMDEEIRAKCEFYFIGRDVGSEIVNNAIRSLKHDYPDSIIITGGVTREEMARLLYMCDCAVCSSREETGPITMVEGMMFHKVCICSENTGISPLIKDGVNGFVYTNNDPAQLCGKLTYVVENFDKLDDMRKRSRAIYDRHFTVEIFEKNFLKIVDELTNKDK